MGEWREVIGYPNYIVSESGAVMSKKRQCLIAQNIGRGGYYHVNLWRNNQMICQSVHRIVAMAFLENPHNKPQVNHIDGTRLNNHVSNLEWATAAENNMHAARVLKRPFANGEAHGMSTLTAVQVEEIRTKYASGNYFHRDLAVEYGVCRPTIGNIINRKTWGK